MKITTLETAGFYSAFKAMRLPHKSGGDTDTTSCVGYDWDMPSLPMGERNHLCWPGEKDLKLAKNLIRAGTSHAKFTRGMRVWVEITGPWYFFNELVTYTVGNEPLSSTSAMHIDCRGLEGEELQKAKGAIRGDFEYTRIYSINYQCLRNMYFQRRHHRLPEWKEFCEWIKTLPLSELITGEK